MKKLRDVQQQDVDELIFKRRTQDGVATIRGTLSCTLHEARKAFVERYELLRQYLPWRFTCTEQHYWRGVRWRTALQRGGQRLGIRSVRLER